MTFVFSNFTDFILIDAFYSNLNLPQVISCVGDIFIVILSINVEFRVTYIDINYNRYTKV